MTRREDEWLNNYFSAHSLDLTPAALRDKACVLYVSSSTDIELSKHCESVLSMTELHRADRFATEYDRSHFYQRRAFRRFCGAIVLESSQPLSQIDFEETKNGRPYLSGRPGFWFSFSSCRSGFLGSWSSTHGIGVDIEDPSRRLEAVDLAHRFFSETEAHAVKVTDEEERLHTFFKFWCIKEAALKSIGEGLPFGLDAFEFELDPYLRVIDAPADHGGPLLFNAQMIEGTGCCAAAVIRRHAGE